MNLLATIGVRTLEVMFVAGWFGTAIVLLLTAIEDIETLVEKDEPPQP
ncbi:MAG TPA: hypothetical protein VLW84_02240 [Terriglobales bacterium]|nr:hypothetical protein [Terriglobales bacterium]